MTKDDIIRMAMECGFTLTHQSNMGIELYLCSPKDLEMFAALIAAHEREACAKVCEENADDLSEGDWDSACINCADHIRERGKA